MNIAEDLIKDKRRDLVSATENTTVIEAVKIMSEQNVGAILVEKDNNIIGIWTERDLLHNFASDGCDIADTPIGKYMSTNLKSCNWNDSVYKLMDLFLGLHLRHLLVKKDGEYIGLISSGDVMKATIHEKNSELSQLNASMSWEYYENWK